MKKLLLAFYGDDFTGSTDALEFLGRAGLNAVLFIEPPTEEQVNAFSNLNAIGVAGLTRSLSPEKMEAVLLPAFQKLKSLNPRHVHYKVCSTFDSSPTVGSIGRAIDVGQSVFQNPVVPVLVGAPLLGRYCVFGNLFARMGIGSNGTVHRLDRHPSMSKHPVTPSDESDLRLHLAKQTNKRIGLVDILQVAGSQGNLHEFFQRLKLDGKEIAFVDALYDEQLLAIGKLLNDEAQNSTPLFSVGSSGIEMALGKAWTADETVKPVGSWPEPGGASPLLVLSGSCSPITKGQIAWALSHEFEEVLLQEQQNNDQTEPEVSLVCDEEKVVALLRDGKSVVVHSGNVQTGKALPAEAVGRALGRVGRRACETAQLKRIVVAGGDTSSYTARAMGIEAVQMIAPLVPGAPLCRAFASDSPVNGVEVNFKGGQVGAENYFGLLREGKTSLAHKRVK